MASTHQLAAAVAIAAATVAVVAAAPRATAQPSGEAAAVDDFLAVARVLQSPRCVNCHPRGDAPLQGDRSLPHQMNISRASNDAGLACEACHRTTNSPVRGGPPGAPKWHLPSRAVPMVFEGRSPKDLCAQLKDPAKTGGKDLKALLEHVDHDPLVLWGWSPGPGRTLPPMPHAEFVGHARGWIAAGAPCPR